MAVHFDGSQADEWVDKGLINDGGRVYRRIRALERLTIPSVDGVVFMSASATESLRRYGLGLDASACQLLPNFATAATSRPDPDRGADLVTLGGLELYKNHQYLLHVLAAAKQRGHRYTLDIIGDGPTRRPLAATRPRARHRRSGAPARVRAGARVIACLRTAPTCTPRPARCCRTR